MIIINPKEISVFITVTEMTGQPGLVKNYASNKMRKNNNSCGQNDVNPICWTDYLNSHHKGLFPEL